MLKSDVLSTIEDTAIVAMLRLPSADDALEMAEVLIEAGIPCLQIPMTVPGATEVIAELTQTYGARALIGGGTVLNPAAAEACIEAGAQFIISPVVDLSTISCCNEAGIVVVAGALTPTEVSTAWSVGADMVRIYPCGALGGPEYIQFLRAPFPQVRFLPAGGISLQTAAQFMNAGAAAVEVDKDLVDLDALHAGRTQDIAVNARLYIDVMVEALSMSAPSASPPAEEA